jgi:hypoxanthine phosphoribosyltransferase
MMVDDIARVYFTEEELKDKVHELGQELSREYAGKHPIFVSVLKGSFVFMADLMREVDIYCDVDFMTVSSYGRGTTTTGAVKIIKDLSYNIEGRHLIIIEDILDSGITLSYLKNYLNIRNPASIKICTLLDKPARRKADIMADYVGFICPDEFIVGYGLDYDEKYRNLPYIGVLKPEVYTK